MSNIKPELPGGFQDYLPSQMIPRQRMMNIIRETFEEFGFVPLDTPAIEWEEILTGGDPNFEKQIFKIEREGDSKSMALRFDLTVPLSRVVSAYPQDIELPFKRFQTGKVWRGEKPQLGRYREFRQFDIDIVGSEDMMADSEILAAIVKTFENLGISNFTIKINNRKILNGLANYADFDEDKTVEVIRSIDKLDKIGWGGVKEELTAENGSNLNSDQVDSIQDFTELESSSAEDLLDQAESMLSGSDIAEEGIQELREISENLEALGVSKENWEIDLSIARGMGYYTGPVFETELGDLPSIGSVASGGRYDGLVERFSSSSIPATGISIGIDRLFAALEELELVESPKTTGEVLVLNFSDECRKAVQEVATDLRDAGIPTEVYVGQEETLTGQISYGAKQEFDAVIILGPDELENNTITVKDMAEREQYEVDRNEIIEKIRKITG